VVQTSTHTRGSVQALHVKFVWPDENCESREFCLWAGRVLQDKVIQHQLAECRFSFNLLVHSDDQAPSASFLPSSSTVQVRIILQRVMMYIAIWAHALALLFSSDIACLPLSSVLS
jgi:hypothetical protein